MRVGSFYLSRRTLLLALAVLAAALVAVVFLALRPGRSTSPTTTPLSGLGAAPVGNRALAGGVRGTVFERLCRTAGKEGKRLCFLRPLRQALVVARPGNGAPGRWAARSQTDGQFALRLKPGLYRVDVASDPALPQRARAVVVVLADGYANVTLIGRPPVK